ncbi:MAG: LCP family protein [Oscillospiraceae bacterium]
MANKRKKTRRQKLSWPTRLLIFLIVAGLLASIVVAILNLRPAGAGSVIDSNWKTPSYLRDKTMNILVCGVDLDEDRNAAMTDVLMVVSLNMEDSKATIMQIPRDTYVGEDLVQTGKINALYNWGYKDGSKKDGLAALVETINDQFKLPIDNYVMITMEGFRKAIDLLGGIDITLSEKMVINLKDKNENIIGTETFDVGVNHLDGVKADLFVRNRDYASADIARMKVQRIFMAALFNKLTTTSTMNIASAVNSVYEYLETDFTIGEILQLLKETKALSGDSIKTVRIPGEPVAKYGKYGLDVYTVHKKELADILNKYMRPYADAVPETELNVIQIQKTTDWYDEEGSSLEEYTGG